MIKIKAWKNKKKARKIFKNISTINQNFDFTIEDWRYLPEYMTSPNDKRGFKFDYALVKLKTNTDYD
jgi:hypothetical protein